MTAEDKLLLLARLMDQCCFARGRLSSVVYRRRLSSSVTLPADGRTGRRVRGRSTATGPGTCAVGRPTLHGGPVQLRPVKATPCSSCDRVNALNLPVVNEIYTTSHAYAARWFEVSRNGEQSPATDQ